MSYRELMRLRHPTSAQHPKALTGRCADLFNERRRLSAEYSGKAAWIKSAKPK